MRFAAILFLLILSPTLLASELTVATFNIRYAAGGDRGDHSWDTRRPLVVETIRKINPDILGIQEGLSHQVEFLAKELTDYKWIGIGRDDGKKKGEFSAIFYRTERLIPKLDAQGAFWLSDTPNKPGSVTWGNSVTRICTWADLVDLTTKKSVSVFNTHWDHIHQGSREKSADLVFRRSMMTRKAGPPSSSETSMPVNPIQL